MGDEKRRGDEDSEANGPGQVYMPIVLMENLSDKLRLLNFDKEFFKEFRRKPVNRHYFALPAKAGEQFYTFSILATWLIRKTGAQFDTPQEEDDPNSVISNIMDALRYTGTSADFPPNKLKQGYGELVIFVLDKLADEAIKKANFDWGKPSYPAEEAEEETLMDDDAEVNLSKIEEEMFNELEDDGEEEEHILTVDDLRSRVAHKTTETASPEGGEEQFVDITEWKLEVERVIPQLKVTIRPDSKDWRSHLDQMQQYRSGITESLTSTQAQLEKLQADIGKSLEKITSRERYLNTQLESVVYDLRSAQERLSQIKQQYSHVSGGVQDRQHELSQITDELEAVKQEMEERGSNMSDGTPVVNIKKALNKLKAEISAMEVRRGVVEHILLQARIRDKQTIPGIHSAEHMI